MITDTNYKKKSTNNDLKDSNLPFDYVQPVFDAIACPLGERQWNCDSKKKTDVP